MSEKTKPNTNTGGGNDEAFMVVAFAVCSVIALYLYLPVAAWVIKSIFQKVTGIFSDKPKRRKYEEDEKEDAPQFKELANVVLFLPRAIMFVAKNPATVMAGASTLWYNKGFALSVTVPQTLSFFMRPKLFVIWIWLFLLSSTMYTTLTFDPHRILGIAASAEIPEIKKAYRKLARINHPDLNKTAEAKIVYPQVVKAYKALVEKKDFEEETGEEFSVGIALPTFLTSREHDGLVLFGLLGILFAVPALIYYYFSGSPGERIEQLLSKIKKDERLLESIYESLGVPQDPKFIEKRRQREELFSILNKQGLLPPGAQEQILEKFPSLSDFRTRCLDLERYGNSLINLGFDKSGLERLHDFFQSYPEIERPEREPTYFHRMSQGVYRASEYFIKQVNARSQENVEKLQVLLQNLTAIEHIEFPTTRRLVRHREEVLETLERVYRPDQKPVQRDIQFLVETPRRREELVTELYKDVDGLFKRIRKHMEAEQRRMMGNARRGNMPQEFQQ